MFKKIFFILFLAISVCLPSFVFADNVTNTENTNFSYSAIISSEDYVQVGKKIIFDASKSFLPETAKNITYYWQFGDDYYEYGSEVVHDYKQIGNYTVNLTISYLDNNSLVQKLVNTKNIFVYSSQAVMIVDEKNAEEISLLESQAKDSGVALKILSSYKDENFFSEDSLVKVISENSQYIKNSDQIFFYTKSLRGLQSFTQYFKSLVPVDQNILKDKFFVVITEGDMGVVTHGVYQNYKIINPNYILLTRPEAIVPILSMSNIDEIETSLFGRGIEFKHVDTTSSKNKFYILSTLVNYFIERGVPADSVYLILIIPFLSAIIVFFRNVIGIDTFGIFTPVIITIAFYLIGLPLGILSFFFAVLISHLMKYVFEKLEILYLSKVALNLSFISISFLFLIAIILKLNLNFSLAGAIFPMLVMSTLAEKFMEAKSETGLKSALMAVLETLFVVILSYYFIIWSVFNNLLLSWPEMIVLPILLLLLMGKFTGLRISEYLRFRSLFVNHTGEEE